jgi:hypothetical protein
METGHEYKKNVIEEKLTRSEFELSNTDKVEMYARAMEDKRWLSGSKSKRGSYEADWSQLDFFLAAYGKEIVEAMRVNHVQGMQAFWSIQWEYLEKIMRDYKALSESYMNLIGDSDDMLANHGLLKIKSDLFEKYLEEKMGKGQRKDFQRWYKAEEAKIQNKMDQVVVNEEKRNA